MELIIKFITHNHPANRVYFKQSGGCLRMSVWIALACYTRDKGLDFNFNISPIDSITPIKCWHGERALCSSASDVGIACPDDYYSNCVQSEPVS